MATEIRILQRCISQNLAPYWDVMARSSVSLMVHICEWGRACLYSRRQPSSGDRALPACSTDWIFSPLQCVILLKDWKLSARKGIDAQQETRSSTSYRYIPFRGRLRRSLQRYWGWTRKIYQKGNAKISSVSSSLHRKSLSRPQG